MTTTPMPLRYFQQDNASAHKSMMAKGELEALSESRAFAILPWPPYSPDLSLIENFWGTFKRHLDRVTHEQGRAKTVEELMERVKTAMGYFNAPEQRHHFRALYDSMPKRVAKCIKSHGAPIDY